VQAFGSDTPVLVPDRVEYSGKRSWLLWPALQYRVVTPLVHEPAVNAFQRALLGLSRAGQRDLAEISDLLGLEVEFAELVRDDLRTLKYLDESGAITASGEAALADGFLDPQRIVVTYVYQDPFTGVLWPATLPAPVHVGARWRDAQWAELELSTAKATVPIRPLAVPVNADVMPDAPTSDEIIEAVSRGTQDAMRGETSDAWQRQPPERVATRVSLVTAGQPVYLPVVVAVVGGNHREDDGGLPTWLAFSPFSGRSSPFLRRLVAVRCDHYPPLRRRVETLIGRPSEAILADYDQMNEKLRTQYGELLDRRFTHALRKHREIRELLTLLEKNVDLARMPGERGSEMGLAANIGWRIQEVALREIIRRHPARFPDRSGEARTRIWQRLMGACERIKLQPIEYRVMSAIKEPREIRKALSSPDTTRTPGLLAAAVVSADQGGPDHPVRRLAQRRPRLLTDLTRASQIRNDGSHAALDRIDLEFVDLSRRLAHETVAAFLGVPAPDDT
jgi:hypothetical protein